MRQSDDPAPNYSDWTKARLIGRLEKLQNQIDKHEAEELELSRLAAIVESSADAIIGLSVDGIITAWNAAAENMFGYTADEAIGKSISLVAPPRTAG